MNLASRREVGIAKDFSQFCQGERVTQPQRENLASVVQHEGASARVFGRQAFDSHALVDQEWPALNKVGRLVVAGAVFGAAQNVGVAITAGKKDTAEKSTGSENAGSDSFSNHEAGGSEVFEKETTVATRDAVVRLHGISERGVGRRAACSVVDDFEGKIRLVEPDEIDTARREQPRSTESTDDFTLKMDL